MNKRASITLEAAVAFTTTIVFIAGMVSMTVFMRSDILMQRAVRNTCREISLITPVSTSVTDTVSTVINAMPDISDEGMEMLSRAADAVTVIDSADVISGGSLTEMILDRLFSQKMENEIAAQYISMNGGSDAFMPRNIDVDLETDTGRNVIGVRVRYETDTILGTKERYIYDVIPFYGDMSFFLNPREREEADTSSIWDEGNFRRGEYFAEEYGCNLPPTFPVINSFENGTATGITSVDLTSPWYDDTREIDRRMRDEIDSLAEFNGASRNIDGVLYEVPGEDIYSRVLHVVIPENSPEDSIALIEDYRSYAFERGVSLDITLDGISRRYQAAEDQGEKQE
ncbi:MAG: hypothetical protein J5685_13080 [Clostridiales bacterium]|nr:hypothetical protein [Clostridiales bacterium]